MRRLLLSAAVLLISACGDNLLRQQALQSTAFKFQVIELRQTPFYSQQEQQCGPAALATILDASGVEADLATLSSEVYIPGRKGSLQLELQAGLRRYGRLPYRVDSSFRGLLAELREGRPVLVLQNLGLKSAPVWHYAVVVGWLPETREMVLRSGTTQRLVVPVNRFLRSWRRAGSWGLVALSPAHIPGRVNRETYLREVAVMESIGRTAMARDFYRTALARWPDSKVARLGLANTSFTLGQYEDAEAGYSQLLETDPANHAARNNLAVILAGRGCFSAALEMVGKPLADSTDAGPLIAELERTRREIQQRRKLSAGTDFCGFTQPKNTSVLAGQGWAIPD